MFFAPRIRLKELAGLCRRLALAVDAGIDDRRIWQRESQQGSAPLRARLELIRDSVDCGDSVYDALLRTGNFFPVLMREMVHIGEQTGKLGSVLKRLSEHYEHLLRLRREFMPGLVWPLIQLVVALGVVGLLIWITGVLGVDILGWGLMGTGGLAVYLLIVAALVLALWMLVDAARRGLLWTAPIQRGLLALPVIGRCLRTVALARLTWTLHLALDVEMDLRRVLPLALSSTGNAHFTSHGEQMVTDIAQGREIHEALERSGAFPRDFVHAVEAAEESGKLVESMGHLSLQYEEEARAALRTLTVAAGFAVWGLVALLIIALIFRLFSFYLGVLNDAQHI